MPGTADHPFTGPAVRTVPLNPPPLDRVLAQIRFSPVLAVAEEAFAGRIQQELAEAYPIARGDLEFAVAVPPSADIPPSFDQVRLWRFHTEDETWRVTLSTSFIALETTVYRGHEDFFARFRELLELTGRLVRPPQVVRTGVRYIQRMTEGDDLARLPALIRPEILGACAIEDDGARLDLCLTQTQATFDETHLTARWGLIPPGAGVDAAVPPIDMPSWLMDIDVFDDQRGPFDPAAIADRVHEHSRRQYRFFRWAIEPEFLLNFGADPEQVAAAMQEVPG